MDGLLEEMLLRAPLPLHEARAVEVNTVENKKAHVGVLKGRFLGEQEGRAVREE